MFVVLRGSFAMTIVSIIILIEIGASGIVHSEETIFESKHVVESKKVSREIIWSKNYGGTLSARCNSTPCLILCCSAIEQVRYQGRCTEDENAGSNTTVRISDQTYNVDDENLKVIDIDNYCGFIWMTSSILRKFRVLSNLSIYDPDYYGNSLTQFEHYCLYREPGSHLFFAKVCRKWLRSSWWKEMCLTLAMLIMLAVFICYNVTPELRNLNGTIFRSYIATYEGLYLTALLAETFTERAGLWLAVIVTCAFSYFASSCGLWTTVMSFNIWHSFHKLRPIDDYSRERDRKSFRWYAIYAWGIPAVIIPSCAIVLLELPYFQTDTYSEFFMVSVCTAAIVVAFIVNTITYTVTALNIRRYNAETANVINGKSKHHEVNEQWFNLYGKLFIIMGGHLPLWLIWVIWIGPTTTHIQATFEVVQGTLIFAVFIWKANIKRSFRKQFTSWLSYFK